MPPWAAVLIAISATLAGFAFEAGSGHTELGFVFAAFYALGCIAAVLAVRHSGIFTAVIQPPLLLFVAVPLGYFLLHGSAFAGLKDVLITCGYPLIERFPLMLFTSATVLVIGLGRWYFSVGRDHSPTAGAHEAPETAQPGMFAGLAARFAALTRPATDGEPRHGARSTGRSPRPPRQQRPERPQRSERPQRPQRSQRPERGQRGEPTRSRQARPPREAEYDPGYDPAPRPRRQPPRGSGRDADPRARRPREGDRRTPPPRERNRDSRFESYPQPGRGYESYREPYQDPYDYPADPPRRRPAPGGSSGTHHPVSRVRYRDSVDPEDRPRR